MKLKKIASLMLAGIMAVSMLAGCGEGKGNGSSSSSSSQPASTGIVAAVEGAIKKYNKDLVIAVKESDGMNAALNKYYSETYTKNVTDAGVIAKLQDVFGKNATGLSDSTYQNGYDFIANANNPISYNNRTAGTLYFWTILDGDDLYNADFETYAVNAIGDKMAVVENEFDGASRVLKADYEMYVYAGESKDVDGKATNHVVAVVKATYTNVPGMNASSN